MAETADEPHSVKLARLFLEPADEQHSPIGVELFFLRHAARLAFGGNGFFGLRPCGHRISLTGSSGSTRLIATISQIIMETDVKVEVNSKSV
jgi:hypothetical protein